MEAGLGPCFVDGFLRSDELTTPALAEALEDVLESVPEDAVPPKMPTDAPEWMAAAAPPLPLEDLGPEFRAAPLVVDAVPIGQPLVPGSITPYLRPRFKTAVLSASETTTLPHHQTTSPAVVDRSEVPDDGHPVVSAAPRVGRHDMPIQTLRRNPLRYPRAAHIRGQQGTVEVRIDVDATGSLQSATIFRSSGFQVLDEAALSSVSAWTFQPAQRNGRPTASSVIIPVEFRLQK